MIQYIILINRLILRRKNGVHSRWLVPFQYSHHYVLLARQSRIVRYTDDHPILVVLARIPGVFEIGKVVKCDHTGLLIHVKNITAKLQPPAASIDLKKLLILTSS